MLLINKILTWIDRLFKKPRTKLVNRRKSRKKSFRSVQKKATRAIQSKKTVPKSEKKRSMPAKRKPGISRSKKAGSVSGKLPARTVVPKKSEIEGRLIGEVTHYFDRIKVCVVRIDFGTLKKGDQITINGKKSKLTQTVDSLQIENEDVAIARKGQLVGLKVKKVVTVGSKVSCLDVK